MANSNVPKSFLLQQKSTTRIKNIPCSASYAGKVNDVVFLDSAGRATATPGMILGIQTGGIRSVATQVIETTASASAGASEILVDIDLDAEFVAQISTFALTDPYTTAATGNCFDLGGSAGAYYINAASSSDDLFKVLALADEWGKGTQSEIGAYAKVLAKFNPVKHFAGPYA